MISKKAQTEQMFVWLGVVILCALVISATMIIQPIIMRVPQYISRTQAGVVDSVLAAPENVVVKYGTPSSYRLTLIGLIQGQDKSSIKFITFSGNRICVSRYSICEFGGIVGWEYLKLVGVWILRGITSFILTIGNLIFLKFDTAWECFKNIIGFGSGCQNDHLNKLEDEINRRLDFIRKQLSCDYFTINKLVEINVKNCVQMSGISQFIEDIASWCGAATPRLDWLDLLPLLGGVIGASIRGKAEAGDKLEGCFYSHPKSIKYSSSYNVGEVGAVKIEPE